MGASVIITAPAVDPGLSRTLSAFATPGFFVGVFGGLIFMWWAASRRR